MLKQGASRAVWDKWHVDDGPRYPHAKVIQYCLRHYKPAERKNTHALDLGCGNGVNSLFLAGEGFKVDGIDFSPTGVAKAQKLLNDHGFEGGFSVGGIDQLDTVSMKYDLIISVGVLDCAGFDTSKKAIEKITKILKKNGRGLFVFASNLDFRLKIREDLSINGFTEEEVTEIFSNKFALTHYDRYITTYENGVSQQNDWLITIQN